MNITGAMVEALLANPSPAADMKTCAEMFFGGDDTKRHRLVTFGSFTLVFFPEADYLRFGVVKDEGKCFIATHTTEGAARIFNESVTPAV